MFRSHKCNELSSKNIWEEVILSGWVSNRRDHWWIIFIDLRDRYWLTQIVFDPKDNKQSWETADSFRSEYVIKACWKVRSRPEWQANPNMQTGDIEVIIDGDTEILSVSKTPPFEVDDFWELANEEVRYKHRYIDLRRPKALENIKFRSNFITYTRNWFVSRDFLDIQTPIFTASSPEWARDFIIPSRLHPGKFYALPQAPQQYKQLLMVWWVDKYFQIAPCFRDEDPRADRHACEFYQVDCEMSFVNQEDIFQVVENYLTDLVWELSDKKISSKSIISQKEETSKHKFSQISYLESMEFFGTDRPDLRYDMKLIDVADIFSRSQNEIFSSIASDSKNNRIKAIKVTNGDNLFSKTQMKNFEKYVSQFWAKGLWYFQMKQDGLKWPLNKFFSDKDLSDIIEVTDLKAWDVVFFGAWEKNTVLDYMWKFRVYLSKLIDEIMWWEFIPKDELAFCWITDFPMFEISEINWKIDFGHNPFSMPKWWIKAFEKENLLEVESDQYDLSCNGYEVLSGSIRNHDFKSLVKAFEKIWRNQEEVKEKFGAMYEAFQYWVPPHWGFAIGMDRLIMILKDEDNIREIYAFPKSGKAQDLMMNTPCFVEDIQLKELSINVLKR